MNKPVPINLTSKADLLQGSKEFLRMWYDGNRVLCFLNPAQLEADPMALGVALVDAVRHGARAWAHAVNISEAEAEARIWEGLDAERATPTDPGQTLELTDALPEDDAFISYTRPGKPH